MFNLLKLFNKREQQMEKFIADLCNLAGVDHHLKLVDVVLAGRLVSTLEHNDELRHGCADITTDWILNSQYFGKTISEAFLNQEQGKSSLKKPLKKKKQKPDKDIIIDDVIIPTPEPRGY
jgi:hypothetical protein